MDNFAKLNLTADFASRLLLDSRELAKSFNFQHYRILETYREHKIEIETDHGTIEVVMPTTGKGERMQNLLLTEAQAIALTDLYFYRKKEKATLCRDSIVLAFKTHGNTDATQEPPENLDQDDFGTFEEALWEGLIDVVRPHGTQSLLRLNGRLLSFIDFVAVIEISSQPLLNMIENKTVNIEEAFSKLFPRRKITVIVGLANSVNAVTFQKEESPDVRSPVAPVAPFPQSIASVEPEPELELETISAVGGEGLNLFRFRSEAVRFVKVDGRDGAVGVDIARILGYKDPSAAVRDNIHKKHTCMGKIPMQGQTRDVTIIFEPGIYQLIFGSKLALAEEFQDWVFEEVLPTLRKTGTYSVAPDRTPPQTHAQWLAAIAQQVADVEQVQLQHNAQVKAELIELRNEIDTSADRVAQLIADRDQSRENLLKLPLSVEVPLEASVRNKINQIVRDYAYHSGESYSKVWRKLYTELKYRYSYDCEKRAKKSQLSLIDQCEADGMLDRLHATASAVLFPDRPQGGGTMS